MCYSTDKIRHPSLSHYKPILGSGSIWAVQGKVKKISLNSGHYTPDLHYCKQTLKILLEKSVIIDDQVPISYYNRYTLIETTFGNIKNEWFKEKISSKNKGYCKK